MRPGEELNATEVTPGGVLGDRAYAVVDAADGKVGSAKNPKKWPRLFDLRAAFAEPPTRGEPAPPVRITLPDGCQVSSAQPSTSSLPDPQRDSAPARSPRKRSNGSHWDFRGRRRRVRSDYRVVLDACALIPMPLADTLLRMAEASRLYLPKWSQMIMDEVTRNLIREWNMSLKKAQRRESELRRHFPEAWVEGFEPIIGAMTNEAEDRHVLAAAVRAHADLTAPFRDGILAEVGNRGPRPSTFLRGLYDLAAGLFAGKLQISTPAKPREERPRLTGDGAMAVMDALV